MPQDEDNIQPYLDATKIEAERVVSGLRSRIKYLEADLEEAKIFCERMARDKYSLSKQNQALIERVLYLEGNILSQSKEQAAKVEEAISMMENVFKGGRFQKLRDRMAASC